jgi:dGTPase
MKPTRALLDGVLKYKRFWSELPEEARDRHFLYDDQADLVRFVAGTPPGAPVDCSRSVECQIMDWADDTAYSLNDIVDGVHAGLLTVGRLEQWGAASAVAGRDGHLLEEILDAVRAGRIDSRFGRKTGAFLQACRLVVRPGAGAAAGGRTYRHAFDLEVEPETRAEADLYCRIARDLVFYSPQLRHLEHKSDYILRRIFRLLEERYLHGMPDAIDLLPVPLSRQLREEPAECVRARLLCDHLAGLTDASATRTYKRLFDPDFGSWLEPV